MNLNEKEELLALLEAKDNQFKYRKFYTYYFQDYFIDPITGLDISRIQYKNLNKFFDAGASFKERAVIAPNRNGKTEAGSFEMTAHLTKDYPSWWKGKRFPNKVCRFLFVGKTNLAARNVAQDKLLGSIRNPGTGMIPHKAYNKGVGVDDHSFTRKTGVAEAVLDLYVTDIYGNDNQILFASMDQEPEVIEGMTLDGIWFDENKADPKKWYNEAFARTITTNGIMFSTFTPWPDGMTESVMNFIPERIIPHDNVTIDISETGAETKKWVIGLSLDDCPHMDAEQKAIQRNKYKGAEYQARVLGIPALGSGAIYPIPLEMILVEPFTIPQHWEIAFGLDFGWTKTAAVWVAEDPNTKARYLYSEYYKGHATPFAHAESLKMRNKGWIEGVCDPAGSQSNQADGKKFIEEYGKLGLRLTAGHNSIEAGLASLLVQFESGQLKVFSTCSEFCKEYSKYRYDDNGKPAKHQDDHLLDALRYLDSRFYEAAKSEIEWEKQENGYYENKMNRTTRDSWTGY